MLAGRLVVREKDQAGAVLARLGQCEGGDLPEEPIRNLEQNARAIAGVRIGPARAAVFEVDEKVEGRADYRMRARALDVRDKTDATRVVLILGAIEALLVTGIHAVFRN